MSETVDIEHCTFCSWRSTDKNPHPVICSGTLVTRKQVLPSKVFKEVMAKKFEEEGIEVIWPNSSTPPEKEIRSTSATGAQKGVKDERFDLIPIGPLTELAVHYGRGALKYEGHQWRAGYEWGKSYSALMRHLTAFWNGEDYDTCPEDGSGCKFEKSDGTPFEHVVPGVSCYNHTGSHHMVAVAWHSFTLLEYKDRFPEYDDRYKPVSQ